MKQIMAACGLLLTLNGLGANAQVHTHSGTAAYYANRGSRAKMVNLNAYRDHRLLLIFAPSPTESRLEQQTAKIKAAQNGFDARDLLLFTVPENGQPFAGKEMLTPEQADYLRQHFEVKRGEFRVLLVGKDGGVKKKSSRVVFMSDIFGLIDTMPMRQHEMRERGETHGDHSKATHGK